MAESKIVAMPAPEPANRRRKTVPCREDAIQALPPGSGDWRVEGVPGLYVRVGATGHSFRVQRRVRGRVAWQVLGDISAAQARRLATKVWQALKPPPPGGRVTLEQAWQTYLAERPLRPITRRIYADNLRRYLSDWRTLTLEAIARDRAGFRAHILEIAREHGLGVASQTLRCFRAVYNYQREVNPDLPECPSVAVKLPTLPPRDWALSDDELRHWWEAVRRLGPLKRAFWLTCLLTGARCDSVRMLRWQDVDFQRRVITFTTAKAGRSYSIPMADRLAQILERWREQCPPTDAGWVFPSPVRPGEPLAQKVRDDKRGVASAHHLRHTMRTRLAEVGTTPDLARVALGHSLTGDVSQGYITPGLLLEAVRPFLNAVAERYAAVLAWSDDRETIRP